MIHWDKDRLQISVQWFFIWWRTENICLNLNLFPNFTASHWWLLSDQVDILPRLLLPLAGPEELDDDDMEKLPDELQYLEPTKTREPDPDIRKNLIEAIFQVRQHYSLVY